MIADTFAGRVHVEWEKGEGAAMTPLGQLPFFIEYLKQGGLFDGWVAGCPLSLTSPNAPSKRDILGTVMLSVLAGHRRYAHITTLRCDLVNPPLLGMAKVVSEDAVRRALSKIEAEAGRSWLQEQLDYCTRPLLREPWILDVDTTVKPLYGHQEGCAPWLLRGDRDWGNEGVISAAERRGQAYLFKLRLTKRVKRVLERAMRDDDWRDAGAGWLGKHGEIRLMGWSRQRRVVLLRRRLAGVMIAQPQADGQLALGFVEIDEERQEAWEYAVLVTSLEAEVLTIGQLYRDRGDCENSFDELKNHWGWGGFTTHDLTRCRIMARIVALIFNWWNLFVRLADPDHHREAITSRPLLLQAIGRQTNHAGRATVTITSSHGERDRARRALTRIAAFFATLRETAEQLTDLDRWYRILSHALVKYLKGRQLDPPRRLQAA